MAKDVNFFDNIKTGDMLSRISSDTQVVQDGLTANLAMFVQSTCLVIGTLAILCSYSWELTLIICVVIAPQIIVTRITSQYIAAFGATYQKAKG